MKQEDEFGAQYRAYLIIKAQEEVIKIKEEQERLRLEQIR